MIISDAEDDLTLRRIPDRVDEPRAEADVANVLVIVDSVHQLALREPTLVTFSDKARIDRVMCGLSGLADGGRTVVLGIAHLPKAKAIRDAGVFQFLGTVGIDYNADVTAVLERPAARSSSPGRRKRAGDRPEETEDVILHIFKNRFGPPDVDVRLRAWPAYGRFDAVADGK